MKYTLRRSSFLERTWSVRILLALLDEDRPVPKTELVGMLAKGANLIIARTGQLRELGLVKETSSTEGRRRRKLVELTPRGRAVAEHLRAIEDLMRR